MSVYMRAALADLFFIGALVIHVRARILYNLAFPGVFLALAVASLVLGATR
jgi:hypothetical protein